MMYSGLSIVLFAVLLSTSSTLVAASLREPFNDNPQFPGVSSRQAYRPVENFLKSFNILKTVSSLWASPSSRLVEQPLSLAISGHPLGKNLEGVSSEQEEIGHYAGYFKLDRTHDASMFYFFFEARKAKKDLPLVLWMTGGPGCASELALFFENGPFTINNDNKTLSWNPYGWDLAANMIYVDQPINTGFSYSSDSRDMRHDEPGVAQDVYEFLQAFLELHPEYSDRPFYVTGESYGGHYIPAVTSKINNANKAKEGPVINIKGMAIGNGLTQPAIQYAAFPDYAFQNGLITEKQHTTFQRTFLPCGLAAKACGSSGKLACTAAFLICGAFFESVLSASGDGNRNVYDIRIPCSFQPLCYDFSALDKYLALTSVRESLGVGDRKYEQCSSDVYQAMLMDFMRNIEPLVPPLLEDGIRTLVYVGEDDFICNWLGNSRWLAAMLWSGQEGYVSAEWTPFEVGNKTHGIATGYGPLTFLKVYESGHMVPMDQPEAALIMLQKFLKDESFISSTKTVPSPHASAKSNHVMEALMAAEVALKNVVETVKFL